MRMYMGGSEVKLWRDLLSEQNVPNVGLSYIGLLRRNKNNVELTSKWSIADHYPEDQNIFLDSGAFTINKEGAEYTKEAVHDMCCNYEVFVTNNIDRVSLVSELDAQLLGYDYIKARREDFYDDLPPDKFMPIWHVSYGTQELERLCSSYAIVGISGIDSADVNLVPMLNGLVHRYGVRLHGVAMTGRKMMDRVKWDSVASMSWLSPSRFGDTILWVGGELKRYPKDYKKERRRHAPYITAHGFDADKIIADDSTELLKLSLWSWGKFVESLSHSVVATEAVEQNGNFAEMTPNGVDIHGIYTGNKNLPAVMPQIRETSLFEQALIGNALEVKTTDQAKALHSALVDLQAQRVLAMKHIEDSEGGYVNANLSQEIDRLNKLIKTRSEMDKTGFSIHVEASGPQGPGFMSAMLGRDVSDKLVPQEDEEEAPVQQENEDIVEAELLNE